MSDEQSPALVYPRESLALKPKDQRWAEPGPMALPHAAEKKGPDPASLELDADDFPVRWWPGLEWEWE
jgi:hypothetical protein